MGHTSTTAELRGGAVTCLQCLLRVDIPSFQSRVKNESAMETAVPREGFYNVERAVPAGHVLWCSNGQIKLL